MDLGIKGRAAIVCAASKGLGFGCARALAREGVHVLIAARGADALVSAAKAIRDDAGVEAETQVLSIATDVTTPDGRARLLETASKHWSSIDILINNAGGPPPGDFRDWDRAQWIAALDANMLTPIELMKALIDPMMARGFGRIVNITSAAVKQPIDILGLSNGARTGLTGFVAGLSRQVASRGVTINNLLPGPFETDRLQATLAGVAQRSGQSVDAVRQQRQSANPMRRFGTIDEFGAVCAFLCSQHAGYMTGQNVLLDGGAYPGTF